MSTTDRVDAESVSEHVRESQHDHTHLQAASSEADPPSYREVEELISGQEVEMDGQPPSPSGHPSHQATESPNSDPALEVAAMMEEISSEPSTPDPAGQHQERDPQLPPPEHAQPPISPSSTLQRAVVVGGRIVWTESIEQDPDERNDSGIAAATLSHTHEAVDHSEPRPDKATKIFSDIITTLYDEAQCSDPNEPYDTPCFEAGSDATCQKINCRNLFGMDQLLTDTLRRGRGKGWSMLTKIIFPLVPDTARDAWVAGEIATAALGLILSIITVVLRPSEPFGIAHLVFVALFSILVLLDGIFTLKDCTTCKKCYNIYKGEYHNTQEDIPYFKCCTGTCSSRSKNLSDVVRLLASEVLLYPLVICDIFKVITGRRFEEGRPHADRLSIVLVALTTISFILYVYVARFLILVRMMKRILAIRSPSYQQVANYYQLHQNHYDFSVRKSAFWYQLYLLLHVLFQMVTQLLFLIAIAAKIFSDNQNLFDDSSTDRSVHFSIFAWYLIVVGFVSPVLGLLTSIFVSYHWMQEFAIGLCLDIVSIWKMGGQNDFVYIKDHLGDQQGSKITRAIDRFLKFEELRAEFQQLYKTHWCKKFVYPYTVPAVAIACLTYVAMHVVVVIYTAIAIGTTEDQSGWVNIYILAVALFTIVANAYTTSVASFWIMVASSSIIIILSTLLNFSLIGIVLGVAIVLNCNFNGDNSD